MQKAPRFYGISGRLESQDKYLLDLMIEADAKRIKPPTIINDIAIGGDPIRVAEQIDLLVQNRIVGEQLNSTPICDILCENPTAHRYNLGKVCPCCGFRVTENRIESDVWMRAPDEIGHFVNPRFWAMFNAFFNTKKIRKFDRNKVGVGNGSDLMMWFLDPYYRSDEPDSKRAQVVKRIMEEHGIRRGIHYFVDHHKTIFEILTKPESWREIYPPQRNNSTESEVLRDQWKRLFESQASAMFPRHLPVISSKLIVSEEGRRGVMIDPVYTSAIDAVKNIAQLYTRKRAVDPRFMISRALKANRQLAYFYIDFRRENLEQKPGGYRAKVSSTHVCNSGRATISPIASPHDAWKLKAPWRWSVGLLSVDIESKLMDRGYTSRQCERIVAKAAMQYDPLVDEIFKELIKESPGGLGILVLPLRNPTLVQLSIQALWIDEIVTDVNQCSIRISDRVIKMANADFDGDQLMVYRPTDQREIDLAMAYRPDNGFMSSTNVNEVERGMVLHSELISMQNRFLIEADEDEEMGMALEDL
ncbi:hypothetical protein pEaSNUABM9_00050 [Erwinia phage pEa_SNUABM_9]|nr:hypothetical protein pEaSNUABM9_00050 [Erwinia phage pEa_SNUABM_9]